MDLVNGSVPAEQLQHLLSWLPIGMYAILVMTRCLPVIDQTCQNINK